MTLEQIIRHDNGRVSITRDGATGNGRDEEEARGMLLAFEAADAALPWDDADEDRRADRRDRLASILYAVISAWRDDA